MSAEIQTALRSPKSYDLGRTALEAMEAHQVWPTVRNYELWVHYVAEKEGALAQEIDRLIAAGEPITESVGEALAAQFLPEARVNGDILEAGDVLSKELNTVTRAIESAQKSSEAYGQHLASVSESLDTTDADKLRIVVDSLSAATRRVQGENRELESQLADTNAELGRLRVHLEQVRKEAMTDGLTNLANRKSFDETLDAACEQADSGEGLTLAIIDIDHFKGFNDAWGHQIGDQVLRYVASVIGRMGATPRLAARYGGEEFAIIFPAENGRTAFSVLEEIREEVSSRVLKRRSTNEDLGAITVSAGYAERLAGENAASLIERADAALYASKHAGRNRTTAADPMKAVDAAA